MRDRAFALRWAAVVAWPEARGDARHKAYRAILPLGIFRKERIQLWQLAHAAPSISSSLASEKSSAVTGSCHRKERKTRLMTTIS